MTFNSWTGGGGGQNGGGGGFAYTRSSDPSLNTDFKNITDIFVYPNPTTGLIRTNQDIVSQILVYDLTGKKLMETNDSSVDLSVFKNGVYIFKLYQSNTKDWVTKRVVKLE